MNGVLIVPKNGVLKLPEADVPASGISDDENITDWGDMLCIEPRLWYSAVISKDGVLIVPEYGVSKLPEANVPASGISDDENITDWGDMLCIEPRLWYSAVISKDGVLIVPEYGVSKLPEANVPASGISDDENIDDWGAMFCRQSSSWKASSLMPCRRFHEMRWGFIVKSRVIGGERDSSDPYHESSGLFTLSVAEFHSITWFAICLLYHAIMCS
jgi:hypothetical protein